MGLSLGQLTRGSWLHQSDQLRQQERISNVEIIVFYKLMLDVTFHHFSIFVGNNSLSLGSDHIQRERITLGHKYQEMEITGNQ